MRKHVDDGGWIYIPEDEILATSPLIKQDNVTVAYRVVLHTIGDCFVVHNENFLDGEDLEKSNYSNGFYTEVLANAMVEFARRVEQQAECSAKVSDALTRQGL